MRNSTQSVSLRTLGLAFAVVMSPAFLQITTCDRGNIDLSSLELEVGGENLVQGFEPAVRSYSGSTDGSAAVATLRATPAAASSDLSWQWWVGDEMVDSGPIGVGGGEVPFLDIPPEGLSELRVLVEAGAPSARRGYYKVKLNREGVFACTEQGVLEATVMGGGPHRFECVGPTTVATNAAILIDRDVILDGEANLTLESAVAHEVVYVALDVTAELRGFVVTHAPTSGRGTGIENWGTLAVTNSTVSANRGERTCDRACWYAGGGMLNSGTLTLTNSTVSGNEAEEGGGIANYGTLTLTNSTVSGNSSANDGGGIANYGTLTLTHSTVSGNEAEEGGGIAHYGTLTLTHSTVSGNSANDGGGIANYGTLTLTNSTVSENDGDGIWNEGDLTITNTTVSGNTAAGVHSGYSSSALIASSTISGNGVAGLDGYGFGLVVALADSIVQGGCFQPVSSLRHNIESPGNTCGLNNSTDQVSVSAVDLALGPLADNGGPTETHALLPGSVAIDWIPQPPYGGDCKAEEDQRGVSRPQGFACDVGAFELER